MKLTMCFPGGKRKALTLSYDDGVEQDIELLRILDRYGIKSTFNLNSRYFEKEEYTYEAGRLHRPMGLLRAKEVFTAAQANGHEVAVHGYTHPFWEQLPSELMVYDVMRDRERLEEIFGTIIRGAAYPYGTHSDNTAEVLEKCGICYCRTVTSTGKFDLPKEWRKMPATCHHKDANLMRYAEKFVNEKPGRGRAPWLFYLWGHSYEFESDDNWDVIERFCETVGGRDDIWYASNLAIYDYIAAYQSLRYSLRGDLIYNPTAIPVWVERNDVPICIQPGETLDLR